MKKKIKYFLIIFVLILFFIWYKQSRKLPIKFKFEKIENDSIVISSIEDLAEFGNKTKILRYDLICPITNDDMTFSNNDGSDNNVTLESDLNYDFSNESNWVKH